MNSNPQLEVILKPAPHYERTLPLPYELLLNIFQYVVQISDHPIRDLCNIARVCDTWRLIVIGSPSLWTRFNFNELPITDNNLKTIAKIVENKPMILYNIHELSIKGHIQFKSPDSAAFLDQIFAAPNLKEVNLDDIDTGVKKARLVNLSRSVSQCKSLRKLSIKNTRALVGQQKWLADHLIENGKQLEELHLTSSLSAVSSQLFRAILSDYCPMLRVLDISTCDFINSRSFDAIQLAQGAPNLEILRLANVSFRRVYYAPEVPHLRRLEELSMPIGMRDAERDDSLFATLAYGTDRMITLDLRGSSITAYALESMPSYGLRELHIDDICPITRPQYQKFIKKWRQSLEVLSLVKINCSDTVRTCLFSLIYNTDEDRESLTSRTNLIAIRELDLESSDVEPKDLRRFLIRATTLESINLSSCRSLPRGCKGRFSRNFTSKAGKIDDLIKRLGPDDTDSETEIDEDTDCYFEAVQRTKKRRRTKTKRPDYICYS